MYYMLTCLLLYGCYVLHDQCYMVVMYYMFIIIWLLCITCLLLYGFYDGVWLLYDYYDAYCIISLLLTCITCKHIIYAYM